jgi:hypothetical protein
MELLHSIKRGLSRASHSKFHLHGREATSVAEPLQRILLAPGFLRSSFSVKVVWISSTGKPDRMFATEMHGFRQFKIMTMISCCPPKG